MYVHRISIPLLKTHFPSEASPSDGSKNADLNSEELEDYKIPSTEEAYEFQLQSGSSGCEEEQEDILFYFIFFYQFSGFKDKMFCC